MTDDALTGTEDRPIERIPDEPSTFLDWLVLLAGPAIWITHFMVVYLAAEAACTPTDSDQYDILGADALVVLTVVVTVVAALGCAGAAWAARRRMATGDPDRPTHDVVGIARVGFLLALGGLIGVLAVGAPALYLSPVC